MTVVSPQTPRNVILMVIIGINLQKMEQLENIN